MKTKCPWCGQKYDIEETMIGADAQCQSCGKNFSINEEDIYDRNDVEKSQGFQDNVDNTPFPSEQPSYIEETKTKLKPLTCEMCGSTNLLKQDGVFVCQSCGTKYSVEEARKMMVNGTVNIAGTVKVDMSEKLKNLYTIARRAKDEDNSENAAKYYDLILQEDPESWEASFYLVYYKAMSCKIAEISSAASSVENNLISVFDLITKQIPEESEKEEIFDEITNKIIRISTMLGNAATSHFEGIDTQVKDQFAQDYIYNILSSAQICYTWGDLLDSVVEKKDLSCISWKTAINLHKMCIPYCADKNSNMAMLEKYAAKIKRTLPNYQLPSIPSAGCYIATAVYGSYDCPQVWTLRRYRDDTLAAWWFGRCFIHFYYAISPTLVHWFGKNKLFINSWKRILDWKVRQLNKAGVSDLPYKDQK